MITNTDESYVPHLMVARTQIIYHQTRHLGRTEIKVGFRKLTREFPRDEVKFLPQTTKTILVVGFCSKL